MNDDFAAELRRLRHLQGLSLRELARLVHHGKSYLHELETGRKPATLAVARRLDEALHAGGRLADIIGHSSCTHDARPATPTIAIDASSIDAPMGEDDVHQLHDTVRHLVALDTMHGSEGLCSHALRAFRNAHRRLSMSGAHSKWRSDLHVAIAEVGEVAAWLAYDSEHQDVSRQVASEALLVAQLAGDTSMYRFLLSHLSMQATYLGRGVEGLEIADRVLGEAPKSRRVVGMMRVRRARALGQLGDFSEALAELKRAGTELDGGIGPDDPAWTWWLHTAELAVHEARIRAAAGDTRGAVDASERSVLHLPIGQGRDQALYRAWLVSDLIEVRAWREADQVARQLLEKAPVVGSARVPRIIRVAERRAGRAGAPTWLIDGLREVIKVADPTR